MIDIAFKQMPCMISYVHPSEEYGFLSPLQMYIGIETPKQIYFRMEKVFDVIGYTDTNLKKQCLDGGVGFYCDVIKTDRGYKAIQLQLMEVKLSNELMKKEPDMEWYKMCIPKKSGAQFTLTTHQPSGVKAQGLSIVNNLFEQHIFDKGGHVQAIEKTFYKLGFHCSVHRYFKEKKVRVSFWNEKRKNFTTGCNRCSYMRNYVFEGEEDFTLVKEAAIFYLEWCKKNKTLPLSGMMHNVFGITDYYASDYLESYYNIVNYEKPYIDIRRYQGTGYGGDKRL